MLNQSKMSACQRRACFIQSCRGLQCESYNPVFGLQCLAGDVLRCICDKLKFLPLLLMFFSGGTLVVRLCFWLVSQPLTSHPRVCVLSWLMLCSVSCTAAHQNEETMYPASPVSRYLEGMKLSQKNINSLFLTKIVAIVVSDFESEIVYLCSKSWSVS